MNNVYVLLDSSNEITGVYQSMEKAKQAVDDYVSDLQDGDIDAFMEFVECADEPLVLTIQKFPIDNNPAWCPYLLEKTTEYTKAYITWDDNKRTYNIEYKPFNPFPED